MKELFIIISSKYRRPVPRKIDGTFWRQQNKGYQILASCWPEKLSV